MTNAASTAKISRNIIRGQRRQRYVTTCPTNKDMSKAPVKFHFYLLLVMALAQVMDIVDTCTIVVGIKAKMNDHHNNLQKDTIHDRVLDEGVSGTSLQTKPIPKVEMKKDPTNRTSAIRLGSV
ncbi:hypothetical protein GQX74_000609 [Glossina fuscipes]|nr:hypothetical protein GQX74_000609 [Glossina fuscipes]